MVAQDFNAPWRPADTFCRLAETGGKARADLLYSLIVHVCPANGEMMMANSTSIVNYIVYTKLRKFLLKKRYFLLEISQFAIILRT
jgi:hypothetical protein